MVETLLYAQLFFASLIGFAPVAQPSCITDAECEAMYGPEVVDYALETIEPASTVQCKSGYRGVPDCEIIR